MNGNRGAKGSVKDRLISMLYRMRYKKKELKESEYTLESKKRQAEYLKTLKQFSYSNDTDILSDEDKKTLNDVKFKAYFKEELSGEFRLESIENISNNLPQNIDLDNEQDKTKDEIVILEEVKTFINKSLDNINDINGSIDVIRKSSKEKNQNTEQLEKEYEELAREMDCTFLKAGDFVTEMGVDGLHFTPQGHRALAEAIAEKLNNMHRK